MVVGAGGRFPVFGRRPKYREKSAKKPENSAHRPFEPAFTGICGDNDFRKPARINRKNLRRNQGKVVRLTGKERVSDPEGTNQRGAYSVS